MDALVPIEITPTRNFLGTFCRNDCASLRAAARRVGLTSFACIERETSIASITVASSRRTETVACGRATPTIIVARPTRSATRGMKRFLPGARSTRFGRRAGFVKRAA